MLANTSINIQKEISQLVRGRQTSGSHATDEERRGEKIGAAIALPKNDIGQDQQVEDDVEAEIASHPQAFCVRTDVCHSQRVGRIAEIQRVKFEDRENPF